jgi:predicted proteasome-type protease
MTLIVGIRCSDGVVIATDSDATYAAGHQVTIGQQPMSKIRVIADQVILATTGSVGMSQLFEHAIDSEWRGGKVPKEPADAMNHLGLKIQQVALPYLQASHPAAALVGNQAAAGPVICKSILAIPIKNEARLFQFNEVGAPEEATPELPFVALGSGQPIADPFLAFLKRVLWKDRPPTLSEGRFAAAWTVKHVIQTNPGGVGGSVQMASLVTKSKPFRVERADEQSGEQEHFQNIEGAEEAIRKHVTGQGEITEEVPSRE